MSEARKKEKEDISKRKFIRFDPDPMTYAQIDIVTPTDQGEFVPSHVGLIVTESHGGCGLVMSARVKIKKGDIVLLKVGELPVYASEVRWLIKLDKDLIKVGFQYMD